MQFRYHAQVSAADTESLSAPPKPLKCQTHVDQLGDKLRITRRNGFQKSALFLLFWLIGWSAACVVMFAKLLSDFEWPFLLFAIPFFIAEIAVFGVVVWLLLGRQTLQIDRNGATVELSVVGLKRRRAIPLGRLHRAEQHRFSETNDKPNYGVRLITTGQPVAVLFSCDDGERAWLLHIINTHIQSLTGSSTTSRISPPGYSSTVSAPAHSPVRSEGWHVEDQIRYVTLTVKGRFSLLTFIGSCLISLFWNGIVSVFIVHLLMDRFEWFLAVFLVPFVAVGLVMLSVCWLALTASFRSRTWTLNANELILHRRGPIFSRKKRTILQPLASGKLEKRAGQGFNPAVVYGESNWRIILIDHENTQAAAIEGLTEEQANSFYQAIHRRFL